MNMKITDRKIEKTQIIREPIERVWWRWTSHPGLNTFFGIDNKIELTPGGAFEIYFLMDNPYGLRGSEGCKVLSFLPLKMFSFSWNAPPHHKEVRDSEYQTWVVVDFESISESETAITLTHLGWPDDEKWSAVYDYFDVAWDSVMESLLAASGN